MASSSEPLTVDNIRQIWKTEFLPNTKREIRNELKTQIEKINCLINDVSERLDAIESSQQLIRGKYDSVLKSIQWTKKQINDLNNSCEAQDWRNAYSFFSFLLLVSGWSVGDRNILLVDNYTDELAHLGFLKFQGSLSSSTVG